MITVTLKHHFSAGHRIPGLAGPGAKCENLHGHTFGVEWTYRTDSVDVGAIEFAAVKKQLRGWIDAKLDHGYILGGDDKEVARWMFANDFKCYLIYGADPTTEAIAREIARNSEIPGAQLVSVTVTEGPHNAATWAADA